MNSFGLSLAVIFAITGMLAALETHSRSALARRTLSSYIVVAATAAACVVIILAAKIVVLPCGFSGCEMDDPVRQARHRTVVVDRTGNPLGGLDADRGQWVTYDEFPRHVIDAAKAAEDRRFDSHAGVDFRGVASAIVRNRREGRRTGASTIAMQTAQLVLGEFGTHELPPDGTIEGKLAEMSIGSRLVNELSKPTVLEIYLNEVPLGSVVGFEAAARSFFGHGAADLSLAEAATIAAMIRAPTAINPRLHPDRARAERNRVLRIMAEEMGYGDSRIGVALRHPVVTRRPVRSPAYEFLAAVRSIESPINYKSLGIDTLATTLDLGFQLQARVELEQLLKSIERGDFGRYQWSSQRLQGAFVAVDDVGGIRAYVGGRPDLPLGYDRVERAKIRTASTLKSFLLAVAIENGIVSLYESLGSLESRAMPAALGRWQSRLRSKRDRRRRVLEAYERSDNWLAVLLWNALPAWSVAALDSVGIPTPGLGTPGEALGTGVGTPLQIVKGYVSFATGGLMFPIRFHVDDSQPVDSTRIWSNRTARSMEVAMRRVAERGTASTVGAVHDGCGVLAAKTGTVDGNLEFVIVGYHRTTSETITSLMWVGHDSPRPVVARSAGRLLGDAWRRATRAGTQCAVRLDQPLTSGERRLLVSEAVSRGGRR